MKHYGYMYIHVVGENFSNTSPMYGEIYIDRKD